MTKYNMSEIMSKAWSIFRSTGKAFAQCLHESWVIAKMMTMGNLWEKYGKRRIYFSYRALMALAGVELDHYKSGNICYATRNGEKISNAEGGRWSASADGLYYDLDTKKFCGIGRYFDDLVSMIREKINF